LKNENFSDWFVYLRAGGTPKNDQFVLKLKMKLSFLGQNTTHYLLSDGGRILKISNISVFNGRNFIYFEHFSLLCVSD